MVQVLIRSLIASLVILFIVNQHHLAAVASDKGVKYAEELLQNNVASNEAELVRNVHACAEESKPGLQRSSVTMIDKEESNADTKSEPKIIQRSLFSEEKRSESGFVAYSADYGRPKHHPPKNN